MTIIDISPIGLVLGLILVIIPIYIFHFFKVGLIKSTLISTIRMVVQMAIIGLYLRYLFYWNHWAINLLWFVLMVAVAAITTTKRTKLKSKLLFMPIAVGLAAGAFVIGMYFFLLVLQLHNPFDTRYFIPIIGVLLGNMLGVNVLSLSTFYQSISRERQLYYYLLGNGATHTEAITPFIREAIKKSVMPFLANMAVMGLVSMPGTMIGQLLGGAQPAVAIKYQIIITTITFSASMLSLLITLWLARKHSFDEYGRLKVVKNDNK